MIKEQETHRETMTKPTEGTLPSENEQPNSQGKSNGLNLLAEVSTLSWNLVIPIVGGALLGSYLDKRTGNNVQWTLSLLVLGVIISFGNLYNLYMEHGHQPKSTQHGRPGDEVTDDQ
jgi:ATP synthase protein I